MFSKDETKPDLCHNMVYDDNRWVQCCYFLQVFADFYNEHYVLYLYLYLEIIPVQQRSIGDDNKCIGMRQLQHQAGRYLQEHIVRTCMTSQDLGAPAGMDSWTKRDELLSNNLSRLHANTVPKFLLRTRYYFETYVDSEVRLRYTIISPSYQLLIRGNFSSKSARDL